MITQDDRTDLGTISDEELLRLYEEARPATSGEYVQTVASGVMRGLASVPAGVTEFAGLVVPFINREDAKGFADKMRELAAEAFPPAEKLEGSFTGDVAQGVGSGISFLVPGVAIGRGAAALGASDKLLKVLNFAVPATLGAMVEAPAQFYEAEAHGADEATKWRAFLGGLGVGATEAIPLQRMLSRINRQSGGALRRVLVDGLIEGAEEAGQEALQTTLGNLLAQYTYDEDRELMEDVLRGGSAGFFSGVILSGLVSGAGRRGSLRDEAEIATPPMPEGEESIGAQLDALTEGRIPAFLSTEGSFRPDAPEGVLTRDLTAQETGDPQGAGRLYYRDEATLERALGGDLGGALGYGLSSKPADASQILVSRDASGRLVRGVAVGPEIAPEVREAAQRAAGEGGTVEVVSDAEGGRLLRERAVGRQEAARQEELDFVRRAFGEDVETLQPDVDEGSGLVDFAEGLGRTVRLIGRPDGRPLLRTAALDDRTGTVFIDSNAGTIQKKRALLFHELSHALKGPAKAPASQAWGNLVRDIEEAAPGLVERFADNYAKRFQKEFDTELPVEIRQDEGVALLAEDLGGFLDFAFSDPGGLEEIATGNRTLFQTIADFFLDLLNRAGLVANAETRALRRLRDEIAQSEFERTADPYLLRRLALRMREALSNLEAVEETQRAEEVEEQAVADPATEEAAPEAESKQPSRSRRNPTSAQIRRARQRANRLRGRAEELRAAPARNSEEAREQLRQAQALEAQMVRPPRDAGGRRASSTRMQDALEDWDEGRFALDPTDEFAGSPFRAVRYTTKSGRGLLHPRSYDFGLLGDDDAQELEELLNYGLQQPSGVSSGADFAFTEDGEAQNSRLLELLRLAATEPVIRTELELFDEQVVWESSDGQIAFVDLDDENPDIRFGIRDDARERISRVFRTKDTPLFDARGLPTDIVHDRIARKLWDKFQKPRQYVEALRQSGVNVPEGQDVGLAEVGFSGRVEERGRQLEQERVRPIVELLAESGITIEEAGDYATVRDAPRRNEIIAERNEAMDIEESPGSGIPTSEARERTRAYETGEKGAAFKKLGDLLTALGDEKIAILREGDLLTEEEATAWRDLFGPTYVPHKTQIEERTYRNVGQGFNIRGKESFRAKGRGLGNVADNPVASLIADTQTAIMRAEKNKVSKTMGALAEAHPDTGWWEVDAKDPKSFRERADWLERTVHFKRGGKEHTITFADPLMARAMKNLGPDQSGVFIRTLSRVNRMLAAVNTSIDPEFILTNLIRDVQTAGFNLNAEEGRDFAKRVMSPKRLGRAIKGIYRVLRDPDAGGEFESAFKELRKAGGKTGFFHAQDFDAVLSDLEAAVRELAPETRLDQAKVVFKKVGKLIEDANGAVENGVRLAAYMEAKRRGVSDARAAALAKNLTVNFNRKGEWGTVANALYLFFNAGIQGSARFFGTVQKSPTAKKLAVGMVSSAVLLDFVNRILAGDDDDGENFYDKIPAHEKERNLILMAPGGEGRYVKIPLPYGFNVFSVLGQNLGATVFGPTTVGEALGNIGSAAAGSFMPIATDANLVQMASPTILDPIVQWSQNQTWYGAPIRKTPLPFSNIPEPPHSQLYFDSVSAPSRAVTSFLNRLTGGDTVQPGAIDINPEAIDHVVGFVTGGLGRNILRATNLVQAPFSEKPLPLKDVPFLRRVMGEANPRHAVYRFRENRVELRRLDKQIRTARENGETERADYLAQKNENLLRLLPILKVTERRANAASKQEDEEQEFAAYREFNRMYIEAKAVVR